MFSWKKIGRKNPRLSGFDYSTPGMYYVTLNTNNRNHEFGGVIVNRSEGADFNVGPPQIHIRLTPFGSMINEWWSTIPNKFTNVGLHEYVVMPDHFHGIIEIINEKEPTLKSAPTTINSPAQTDLPRVMQWFKSVSTNEYIRWHKINHKYFDRRLWQTNYYEHITRNDGDLDRIQQYIINNPKKWWEDGHPVIYTDA
ncbi:MAG: transposase [Patescibacteria group bacterium]|jgi:REP element-mobilizing transposase RayT